MNPSDLSNREVFRFTGPPENWLTAIKFMTWGLEEKHLARWQRIEPGDIFLMHSTSTHTFVKGAPSAVIGFGVVSPDFRRKDGPLWIEELENHTNKWPLLVPFSEIYLFSKLRSPEVLEAPTGRNNEAIISEAKELLSSSVPLPAAFPKMGSFSAVNPDIAVEVFSRAEKFYLYSSVESKEVYTAPKKLVKAESSDELVVRKPVTLEEMQIIKKKTIKLGKATFAKDMQSLEKAESEHHETLSMLFELLKQHGYETYYNRHVDLFAIKGNDSFLFEVKSIHNKNFRSQSRKGIVQLFEYEYFDINEFLENRAELVRPKKALVYSKGPQDSNYIGFINNLKLGAGYFEGNTLKASGQASAFAGLL